MQRVIECRGGDVIRVSSTGSFRAYFGKGEATFLAGPHSADLRRTSFRAPPNVDSFIVEYDADEELVTDLVQNRFEQCDPSTLFRTMEMEGPQDARDLVANEIRRLVEIQTGRLGEHETIEEANDFDMADEWFDEPFAAFGSAEIVTEEYPNQAEPVNGSSAASEAVAETPGDSEMAKDSPPPVRES